MLNTSPATTLPTRRRGGQPANTNALVHGLRSIHHPQPVLALLPVMPLDSVLPLPFVIRQNRLLVKELEQTLLLFVPRMFSTATSGEMLAWFRPIIKLIRLKQRVVKAIHVMECPARTLQFLSRNTYRYAYLEFLNYGIREYPIAPPPDFAAFCAGSSSTPHAFRHNSILPVSGRNLFVRKIFKKSAQITRDSSQKPVHSPFLTDQQWLRFSASYQELRARLDLHRKYKRGKRNLPDRLLFEAVFIKLAFNITWKTLPGLFALIHPNIDSFPLHRCKLFYREMFWSGFLQSVYRQLHRHFKEYSGTSYQELVDQGCFHIDDRSITLAPGRPLTWQNFTALLLLQRAYHNYRVREREMQKR
jgi:hypothetical protein